MPSPPMTPLSNTEKTVSLLKSRPIHLILDFDGTITTQDTIALLTEVACDIVARKGQERLNHQNLWNSCVAKYRSALENHPDIQPFKEKRTTIEQEISYQRAILAIEQESVSRCGEIGLFKGVSVKAWREAGYRVCQDSRLKIMPGFRTMVEKVQSLGGGTGRWGVVSVNWCRDFLKGVLGFALGGDTKSEWVPVLSNEIVEQTGFIVGPMFGPAPYSGVAVNTQPVRRSRIQVEEWSYRQLLVRIWLDPIPITWGLQNPIRHAVVSGILLATSGPILNNQKRILTSDDKLEAMKSLRDSFKGSAVDQNREYLRNRKDPFETPPEIEPLVVYIGDSLTDLECLLEADVGIVMSPNGTGPLMKALGRNNITAPHISCFLPQKGKSIWFAADFRDIVHCRLLNESTSPPP